MIVDCPTENSITSCMIDGYSSDIPNVVTGSVANTSFQRHATNICTDYLPTRRNKQLPQSKTTRPPTPPHPHSTLDETTHNNRASNISIRSTSVSVWFSHEEIFQRGKVTIHSSFLSNCQCPSYSITTKKIMNAGVWSMDPVTVLPRSRMRTSSL